MFFSMAAKADTPEKPVKGEKLSSSTTSVNDNCALASGDSIASHFIIVGIGF